MATKSKGIEDQLFYFLNNRQKMVMKSTHPRRKKNFWHEVVIPYQLEARFKGVSIGYDKTPETQGYFVFTHRARCEKTYKTIGRIPKTIIKMIEKTG